MDFLNFEKGIVLYVPDYKYIELHDALYGLIELSENQIITKTVFWQNKQFVITGSISDEMIFGCRILQLEEYKGTLKPLESAEHWREADAGIRERSYTGLILKYQNKKYVCCEEYTFKKQPINYIQTHLF